MSDVAAMLAALCGALVMVLLLTPGGRPRRGVASGEPARGLDGGATRTHETDSSPLIADAASALLSAGLSIDACLEALGGPGPAPELAVVARRLRWGEGWDGAWSAAPMHRGLRESLELAAANGAPAGALLRDGAGEQRQAWARHEEAEAASIAVRLVIPLGLCALPAFICVGIVPIALSLLPWA